MADGAIQQAPQSLGTVHQLPWWAGEKKRDNSSQCGGGQQNPAPWRSLHSSCNRLVRRISLPGE